jgi:hypothetical protein
LRLSRFDTSDLAASASSVTSLVWCKGSSVIWAATCRDLPPAWAVDSDSSWCFDFKYLHECPTPLGALILF